MAMSDKMFANQLRQTHKTATIRVSSNHWYTTIYNYLSQSFFLLLDNNTAKQAGLGLGDKYFLP